MKITISMKQLESLGACAEGIEDFSRYFHNLDEVTLNWTPRLQLVIVRSPMRKWLGWAWGQNVLP